MARGGPRGPPPPATARGRGGGRRPGGQLRPRAGAGLKRTAPAAPQGSVPSAKPPRPSPESRPGGSSTPLGRAPPPRRTPAAEATARGTRGARASEFTLEMTPFLGILVFVDFGEAMMYCSHHEEDNQFFLLKFMAPENICKGDPSCAKWPYSPMHHSP